MENEILQQILFKLDKMQNDINDLKLGQNKLEQSQEKMQEDITEIKEHTEVTRVTTNLLGEWVERANDYIKIPIINE